MAVLLVPLAMGKSRDALAVGSASNLMRWGIALNLYLMDNEDRLPSVGGALPDPELEQAWYNALPLYLSMTPLTQLPTEQRPRPGDESLWVDPAATANDARLAWGDFFFSYGMNYWLHPIETELTYKIYRVTAPARTVFLAETAGSRPGLAPQEVALRHGTRPNGVDALGHVLFCDGHVELVSEVALRPELHTMMTEDMEPIYWRPYAGSPEPQYPEVGSLFLIESTAQ